MKTIAATLLAASLLPAVAVQAQPTDVAPAPNVRFTQDGTIDSIRPLASGGVVVTGLFSSVDGVDRYGFATLDADGGLDASQSVWANEEPGWWHPTPRGAFGGPGGELYVVVGGVLQRRTAAGAHDPTFVAPVGIGYSPESQAHFAGDAMTVTVSDWSTRTIARRLSVTTGAADTDFVAQLDAGDTLKAIDFDTDGDLWVVYERMGMRYLARHLAATGARDAGFPPIAFSGGYWQDVEYVDALDAVLVSGTFTRTAGGTTDLAMFAASDGTRLPWESSFEGRTFDASVDGLRASIVGCRCADGVTDYTYLLADLALDSPIVGGEVSLHHPAHIVLKRGDETFVGAYSAGPSQDGSSALSRFVSLAPAPSAPIRATGWISEVGRDGGDIYVSGRFSRVDGHRTLGVVRLRGGSVDMSFTTTSGSDSPSSLLRLGDHVYVASSERLYRYAIADGSQDGWVSPYESIGNIYDLTAGPAGSLYLAGDFVSRALCGAGTFTGMARLDVSGSGCVASAAFAPSGLVAFELAYDDAEQALYALAGSSALPQADAYMQRQLHKLDVLTGAPAPGFTAVHGLATLRTFALGPTAVFVHGSEVVGSPWLYPQAIRKVSRATGARLPFEASIDGVRQLFADETHVYAAGPLESEGGDSDYFGVRRWDQATAVRDVSYDYAVYGGRTVDWQAAEPDTLLIGGARLWSEGQQRSGVLLIERPAGLIHRNSFEF